MAEEKNTYVRCFKYLNDLRMSGNPALTAYMARFRKARGHDRMNVDLVSFVSIGDCDVKDMNRSKIRNALYDACVFYAWHSKGNSTSPDSHNYEGENSRPKSFGKAVGELVQQRRDGDPNLEEHMRKDLARIFRKPSYDGMRQRIYPLIDRMAKDGIAFDYPAFAKDLYRMQLGEKPKTDVTWQWITDFEYTIQAKNNKEEK